MDPVHTKVYGVIDHGRFEGWEEVEKGGKDEAKVAGEYSSSLAQNDMAFYSTHSIPSSLSSIDTLAVLCCRGRLGDDLLSNSPHFGKNGKADPLFLLVDSANEPTYGLLGKELSMFSEAGFDMQKIHLKVRSSLFFRRSQIARLTFFSCLTHSVTRLSLNSTKMPSSTKEPSLPTLEP